MVRAETNKGLVVSPLEKTRLQTSHLVKALGGDGAPYVSQHTGHAPVPCSSPMLGTWTLTVTSPFNAIEVFRWFEPINTYHHIVASIPMMVA